MTGALCWIALAWAGDGPREVQPDRTFDVQHLDLAVEVLPRTRSIRGVADLTVARLTNSDTKLTLHEESLTIHSVHVDDAEAEGWRQSGGLLEIPVPAGREVHQVRIAYDATPQTGLHFRGGRGTLDDVMEVWSQGENEDNRYWFPSWDYPSDTFTVSQHLTVPDTWTAIGNGVQVEPESASEDTPGTRTWHYRLDQPIVNYLVMMAAGEYRVFKDDTARVPLEFVVPATVDEETARRTLGRTAAQFVYFEDLLGTPYPYDIYRQIIVQRFIYGGMENASATILSDRLLVTTDDEPWRGSESTVAHELAHQWYGDLLTCYGWRELWLNEGFATYYAWRWLEELEGQEYAAGSQWRRRKGAFWDTHPMATRGWSEKRSRDNASVYVRGASVLYGLERMLGRDTFDEAIRLYTARNAFRLVETDDLRRAFEDVSGQHLGWYFDQHVHANVFPEVTTSWSWSEGQLTVTLKGNDKNPGTALVDIEVGAQGDVVIRRRVTMGEGKTQLVLDHEEAPRWVAVDPDAANLVRWTHEQSVDAWIQQLQHSPTHTARWEALDHLDEDDAAVGPLAEVWMDEGRHESFRSKAAETLGKIGTDAAIEAILPGLDARSATPSWQRQAVTDALTHVEDSPKVMRILKRLLSDGNPFTRADALEALSSVDSDEALSQARRTLTKNDPSFERVYRTMALRVIRQHGDSSDLMRVLPLVRSGVNKSVVLSAARTAVSLAKEDEEPPYTRVSRVIEPLLDDVDLRTRQTAISLLGRIGDDDTERRLIAFANSCDIERLAESARDAAHKIRQRPDAEEEPEDEASGPDDQRVEEMLDALEKRVEELERWR